MSYTEFQQRCGLITGITATITGFIFGFLLLQPGSEMNKGGNKMGALLITFSATGVFFILGYLFVMIFCAPCCDADEQKADGPDRQNSVPVEMKALKKRIEGEAGSLIV